MRPVFMRPRPNTKRSKRSINHKRYRCITRKQVIKTESSLFAVNMKTSKQESAKGAPPRKKGKKSSKKAGKGRKKPKRPMTAYNYFLREMHVEASKKLEAQNAERKKAAAEGGADADDKNAARSKEEFQRLSKEFGERWRNISPEEHAK